MPAICFHGMVRLAAAGVVREVLDGLADHFELPDDGVLPHAISPERLFTRRRVRSDVRNRLADVTEIRRWSVTGLARQR